MARIDVSAYHAGMMRLMIHFYAPCSREDAQLYCFSNPTGDFHSVEEAIGWAHLQAGPDGNGATEFMITDAADEVVEPLAHRILIGSSWEPKDA